MAWICSVGVWLVGLKLSQQLRVPDLRRVLTPLGNATLYVCMGT